MPFKAAIFDLDGTLLDTLQDLANSYNRALGLMGFPTHPIDAYRTFVGDGARTCAERALPVEKRDDLTIDSCLQLFRQDYAKNWHIYTKPYKGIPDMLTALTELGVHMAVLSNKPQEDTERCVNEYLAQWNFEIIIGQRDDRPKKPDPTCALEISRQFRLSQGEVLFIGDTSVDMETAVAAGMFPVGVLWGFRSLTELIQSGAKATINAPEEIPLLLNEYLSS